jgi:hypothetical protein
MKYAMIAAAVLAVSLAGAGAAAAQQVQAHMGHVLTAWNDTPDGMGFLPTVRAEAEIAALHVGLAQRQTGNLDWMKQHVGHVLNAIDPSVQMEGPGLGYGVRKAAAGVAAHIGFAANSDGASGNVKTHAVHVGASATNIAGWSDEIVALAAQAGNASSASAAAAMVAEIDALVQKIMAGFDADNDGTISWAQGEGGLAQAEQHMGFMVAGEAA